MKHIFQCYILPFMLAVIVFIGTLLQADAANQAEWSPRLYGHLFPILQDGAHSLSMKMHLSRFLFTLTCFYGISWLVVRFFKLKFSKLGNLLISVLFLFVLTFFIMVITIDFSLTDDIPYSFDYSTLKWMWN